MNNLLSSIKKEDFKYLPLSQIFHDRLGLFIANVFWLPLLIIGIIGMIYGGIFYLPFCILGVILYIIYILQSLYYSDLYSLLKESIMPEKKVNELLRHFHRASIVAQLHVEGRNQAIIGTNVMYSQVEEINMKFNFVISPKIVELSEYNFQDLIVVVSPELHVDAQTMSDVTKKRAQFVIASKKNSRFITSHIHWKLDKNYPNNAFINTHQSLFTRSTYIIAVIFNLAWAYETYFYCNVPKLTYPVKIYSSFIDSPEYNWLTEANANEEKSQQYLQKKFIATKDETIEEINQKKENGDNLDDYEEEFKIMW